MFRQLCVLALAFLAVSEAKNHTTKAAKSIKDSKSVKSNRKVKTATMCAVLNTFEDTDSTGSTGQALSTSAGTLFDCADAANDLEDNDFFGTIGFNCMGFFNNDDTDDPEALCHGLITVNTENVKSAKSDFSSIALTTWAAFDEIGAAAAGEPLDLTDLLGTTITGTNGAWEKSKINDISFTRKTNTKRDYYEIDLRYKARGFQPSL